MTVPIANLASVLTQLTAAGQTFQKQNMGLSLMFTVEGASSSQPVSCSDTALLALAQTQAQQVAAAAGVGVGSVLGLSSAIASGFSQFLAPAFFSNVSGLSSTTTSTIASTVPVPVSPSNCTMSVQFQLQ